MCDVVVEYCDEDWRVGVPFRLTSGTSRGRTSIIVI